MLKIFERKPKVNGIIKYQGLVDWWLKELSEDEREIILKTYSPLGDDGSIIEGDVHSSSQTLLHFFWGLIGWFNRSELRHVAYKLISKGESLIDEESDPLDVHLLYGAKLEVFYKDRDLHPNGLEMAVQACEQQIANSPAAASAFKQKFGGDLPSHKGYYQLSIVLEKQKRYNEAITLCEKAKSQGWSGDWDKRIERCVKRLKASR